jgi:23S rRNA C2498 (ribose-2'-O)-methylase RlmM
LSIFLSPNGEDHRTAQIIFALQLIVTPNKEDSGTIKQDLHLSVFLSPNEEDRRTTQNIFALKLIISPNGEDHRTIKQDLHLSVFHLQVERTTGPQNKICA